MSELLDELKSYVSFVRRTYTNDKVDYAKHKGKYRKIEALLCKQGNRQLVSFFEEMAYAYDHGMNNPQFSNLTGKEWVVAADKIIHMLGEKSNSLEDELKSILEDIQGV